ATLVIAPEFRGILAERCRIVERVGGRLLGPSAHAVELCADKLSLAAHLSAAGVATIETWPLELSSRVRANAETASRAGGIDRPFPVVVKPRDGAGSQSAFVIRDHEEFRKLIARLNDEPLLASAIVQPFVVGRAVSAAV